MFTISSCEFDSHSAGALRTPQDDRSLTRPLPLPLCSLTLVLGATHLAIEGCQIPAARRLADLDVLNLTTAKRPVGPFRNGAPLVRHGAAVGWKEARHGS
jgi:hypothetical protein